MSYMFAEEGTGTSENTLAEAMTQAVQSVLSLHKGDHSLSLTIVMDGYDYHNGKYSVRVTVIIHDYTQEHDEMYQHMREAEERKLREEGMRLHHAYYAALHFKQTFKHGQDSLVEQLKDAFERYELAHINDVTVITTNDIHAHLANDFGYDPKPQPVSPKLHTGFEGPSLNPFSSSHKEAA